MPPDSVNLDAARAHLLAVAQDMRAIGLDYYAEHLEYVLREMLSGKAPVSRPSSEQAPSSQPSALDPHQTSEPLQQ